MPLQRTVWRSRYIPLRSLMQRGTPAMTKPPVPTPALNEGCTRLTRISHSMMYCIVPTTCVFTQFPCTPSHPPKIAGVTRCDLPGGASLKCPSTRPSHACCVRTPCNEGLYYHGGLWAAVPLIHHPPSHAPVPPQLCCRAMALEFGGRGGAVGV